MYPTLGSGSRVFVVHWRAAAAGGGLKLRVGAVPRGGPARIMVMLVVGELLASGGETWRTAIRFEGKDNA
jgi:hypothetical protein